MTGEPRNFLIGCETYFLGIEAKDEHTIRHKVFPLRCHSWNCPDCAREKAEKYKKRMRPLFDGRKLWMYTFTYFHSKPAIEVWTEYSKAWNRFRTAASKKFGAFSYARVLEHHHQSDYPHLHVIADKEFTPVWMNRELLSAGFGYQAKCKPITTEGAIFYVTKYLTKQWTSENCKRLRKNLRLRIISFGGGACDREYSGAMWRVVTRDFNGAQVRERMVIERDWNYGSTITKTFERVIDGSSEETYFISDRRLSDGEVTRLSG